MLHYLSARNWDKILMETDGTIKPLSYLIPEGYLEGRKWPDSVNRRYLFGFEKPIQKTWLEFDENLGRRALIHLFRHVIGLSLFEPDDRLDNRVLAVVKLEIEPELVLDWAAMAPYIFFGSPHAEKHRRNYVKTMVPYSSGKWHNFILPEFLLTNPLKPSDYELVRIDLSRKTLLKRL